MNRLVPAVLVFFVALACVAAVPERGGDVPADVVAKFQERNGPIFTDWPAPQAVLVITGELDGYIEPCGCTGKENQKGGLSRRQNFLRAFAAAGWEVVPVDLGGQVKRFGKQTEAKFQSIVDGLRGMNYAAVGFGPGDLRLPAEELVAAVAPIGDQPTPYVSANVGLLGLDAGITPRFRVMEAGGLKIGLTTALIGAVVAEFAQATAGVGVLMARSSFSLDMASSLAALLSMTLIGLILFYSMELLDDRIVFWRRDARMSAVSRARARA